MYAPLYILAAHAPQGELRYARLVGRDLKFPLLARLEDGLGTRPAYRFGEVSRHTRGDLRRLDIARAATTPFRAVAVVVQHRLKDIFDVDHIVPQPSHPLHLLLISPSPSRNLLPCRVLCLFDLFGLLTHVLCTSFTATIPLSLHRVSRF